MYVWPSIWLNSADCDVWTSARLDSTCFTRMVSKEKKLVERTKGRLRNSLEATGEGIIHKVMLRKAN